MSWDKINHMLSKFNFTFTWEYGGDGELRSVLSDVFRILEGEDERSLEQILIGCVHQANPGFTLSRLKNDPDVPYEMKFLVHPPHESFCITKIVLLSEARNLELYVNGGYERSNRGIMLTLNKERKLSLFEAQFDLSAYVETISNATIKFLSHPCKDHMKLQAVVMKVEQCKPISSIQDDQSSGIVNLSSVKRFLGSVGRPLSSDAQQMLQSIENYQKSPAFKAQQILSSQAARLQNMAQTTGSVTIGKSQISQQEEKVPFLEEEQDRNCKPEEDKTFMNMLAELGLKEQIINDQRSPATDITSSSQARWAAFLQSRVRASKNTSSQSSPEIPRSMSLEGYSGISEDHQAIRTRQRPNSVGCVSEGGLDRSFNPGSSRQEESQSKRCTACGCPGCISAFSSISTNIFAMEKRILENMDQKVLHLQEDLNAKFILLYELLDKTHVIDNKED